MHLTIKEPATIITPDGVEHARAVVAITEVLHYWKQQRIEVYCEYFHSIEAAWAGARPLEGNGLQRFRLEFNGNTAITYSAALAALYVDEDGEVSTTDASVGEWVLAQVEARTGEPFSNRWEFVN